MAKRDKNRLRVVRADRNITQLDTALKAGLPHGRYWRIENGYRLPTPQEQAAIAKALKADVAEVFPQAVGA
jgi:transcriptional regulator with XRE-family HTH domain